MEQIRFQCSWEFVFLAIVQMVCLWLCRWRMRLASSLAWMKRDRQKVRSEKFIRWFIFNTYLNSRSRCQTANWIRAISLPHKSNVNRWSKYGRCEFRWTAVRWKPMSFAFASDNSATCSKVKLEKKVWKWLVDLRLDYQKCWSEKKMEIWSKVNCFSREMIRKHGKQIEKVKKVESVKKWRKIRKNEQIEEKKGKIRKNDQIEGKLREKWRKKNWKSKIGK